MIVRLFHPWIGGTERQAHKLAAALRGHGAEVHILTGRWFPGTPRREAPGGVPVIRHGTLRCLRALPGMGTVGGYAYVVTLWWQLWRLRHRYDVIHVHGLNYHAWAAVVAGRRLGRPVVVKVANSGPASDVLKMREGRQLRGSHRLLAGALAADRFVALNDAVVDELEAAGVPSERIVRIANGVEVPPVAGRTRAALPAEVLYLGRLHAQKGLDTLIRAVGLVERDHPGALRLRLVGDGPERPALDALVRQFGLAAAVEIAGPTGDVAAALATADVLVLPSRAEGLSNALLEAMAAGLPVVATRIPGNTAAVTDGHQGLLVPPGDAPALAAAMAELALRPELRRRMGAAARRTAEQRYALGSVAGSYLDLYQQLVSAVAVTARPSRSAARPAEASP
jgi:glycosyltransferase involved in cell wall biosynthesis